MTLVTGTVQDLGYEGMDGTLWARPARFRSDGQVVYAPERKPHKVVDGVVSADLAPGPAVLELQVGSHARGTFEVVIPDADTTLADLMDTVFPWEPEQVSLFVAERERAEKAKSDAVTAAGAAETAAGTATTAAQQTGQDRTHVDQVRVLLDEAYDESQAGMALPPRLTETALNATYVNIPVAGAAGQALLLAADGGTEWGDVATGGGVSSATIGRLVTVSVDDPLPPLEDGDQVVRYRPPGERYFTDFANDPLGSFPEGWQVVWNSSLTDWAVAEDGAADGETVLRKSETGAGRRGLAVSGLESAADAEVLLRFRAATSSGEMGALARARNLDDRHSGYGLIARVTGESTLELALLNDGSYGGPLDSSPTNIVVGDWALIRMQARGGELSARAWADGTTEPSEWQTTAQLAPTSALLEPGATGLYASGSTSVDVDWVAIGTGLRPVGEP